MYSFTSKRENKWYFRNVITKVLKPFQMNPNIEKLYALSRKDSRVILGLMSGTSLDGLDLALCHINGSGPQTSLHISHFETIAYTPAFRSDIQAIFAKESVGFKMLCAMNAQIAITHAQIINETLKKWNLDASKIDLIASHGQTVYHAPSAMINGRAYPNSTFQIGDGDHISVLTGIITLSDFRQKHIAAGGEGAPLAIYGDYLLFSQPQENRIMLNIGGMANFTYLPASQTLAETLSTDVGPGNTLLNQYMKHYFDLPYDQNGRLAAKGIVHTGLLKTLISHPFFERKFPKTTGPEEFNLDVVLKAKRESKAEDISHEDCLATLVALTAYGIANAVKLVLPKDAHVVIYLSGGGLHNPTLVHKLKQELPDFPISSTEALGVPPDAKEAALFALLANETLVGKPLLFPEHSGAPAVSMGKISFPN